MKGIIAKDLYEIFRIKKNLINFLLIYVSIMFEATFFVNSFMVPVFQIFGSTVLIPFGLTNLLVQLTSKLDEKFGYQKYQISGPIDREDIVNSKYLMSMVFMIINSIVLFLMFLINVNIWGMKAILILVAFSTILSIFSLSIGCPSLLFFQKWGAVPLGIIMIISVVLQMIFPIEKIVGSVKDMSAMNVEILLIISLVLGLVALLISYFVTKHFYSKKEFK
ncbi:ABC-2 transporter permease [Floricoccus penangensis]|uniref:ABC-2 transporter permease n=1 Tax=Floricoccus penangensis TaxID=1859475 RepID=UPI00203C6C08|nr:ABC-2 transporter permease [Floricoccus penangensis]URZ88060.1 ABC-2 transporter permease [Floricoccus penangensis]